MDRLTPRSGCHLLRINTTMVNTHPRPMVKTHFPAYLLVLKTALTPPPPSSSLSIALSLDSLACAQLRFCTHHPAHQGQPKHTRTPFPRSFFCLCLDWLRLPTLPSLSPSLSPILTHARRLHLGVTRKRTRHARRYFGVRKQGGYNRQHRRRYRCVEGGGARQRRRAPAAGGKCVRLRGCGGQLRRRACGGVAAPPRRRNVPDRRRHGPPTRLGSHAANNGGRRLAACTQRLFDAPAAIVREEHKDVHRFAPHVRPRFRHARAWPVVPGDMRSEDRRGHLRHYRWYAHTRARPPPPPSFPPPLHPAAQCSPFCPAPMPCSCLCNTRARLKVTTPVIYHKGSTRCEHTDEGVFLEAKGGAGGW